MMKKTALKRKCKICKKPAKFNTAMNKGFCGDPVCGLELHKEMKIKQKDKEVKEFKADTRARKLKLDQEKPSWWIKNIQQYYFNPWVKIRDKDMPCISCGEPGNELTQWDAGHYLSVGAFPELRFEPLNCYKQCRTCNRGNEQWTKGRASVTKRYRINLIERMGIELVEWLEGPHEPKRYRVPELEELQQYWKQKLKEEKAKHE